MNKFANYDLDTQARLLAAHWMTAIEPGRTAHMESVKKSGRDILYARAFQLFQDLQWIDSISTCGAPSPAQPTTPVMKATRHEVFDIVSDERDYQDELWPCGAASVGDFATLLRRYSNLLDSAVVDNRGNDAALHVVRKIAAIAVRCMEMHGALPRETQEENR